jgi:opacity protein-like surface antigen
VAAVVGRAGALWVEMDATLQWQGGSPDERAKIRETTTELIWGIGAAYHASSQWTLRLEYQQVPDVGDSARSGELDIERYTLNWVYSY